MRRALNASARGKRTRTARPLPAGPSSSVTVAPCASAIRRTIDRPRPLPPACAASSGARCRDGSARRRARARRPGCPVRCRSPPAPPGRRRRRPRRRCARLRACSAARCRAGWRAASPGSPHRRAPGRPRRRVQPRSMPLSRRRCGARATIASLASAARSHPREVARQRLGLEPRHRQQLLDQPRRAVDAGLEFGHRRGARRRVGRALGEFDLQRQRRERRAQFVRGVRRESPLRGERLVQPREQRVEARRQRLQLPRQPVFRQRRHRVGPALRDRARHRVERPQPAADRVPDQHAEKRNQQRERQQRAQRRLRGDLAALVERVRDLQRVAAVDVRVDAPLAAVAARRRNSPR